MVAHLRNERGVSIIEALIASGLMITVLLGLSSSMNFSHRASRSIATTTDFNSLVASVQAVLNNSVNCEAALDDHSFHPPTTPGPLSTPQSVSPLKTQGGVVIAQLGRYGQSLEITQLAIISSSPLSATNQHLVVLRLAAKKLVGGGAVGTQNIVHDFPISLAIDPLNSDKIVACAALSDIIWNRAANGTDIYYSAGDVGIGTSSPTHKLHTSGGVRFERSNKGIVIDPNYGALNQWIQFKADTGMGFVFQTGCDPSSSSCTKNAMNIDNNGNIGIGTETPEANLDVRGGIRPGSSADVTTCNSSTEGTLRYVAGDGTTPTQIQLCQRGNGTNYAWVSGLGGSSGQWKHITGSGCSACPYGSFASSGIFQNCYTKTETGALVGIGNNGSICQSGSGAMGFGFFSY